MSETKQNYKIIFPEGYLAEPEIAQKEGLLEDVIVRFEDGSRYRLHFTDFYLLAQEFVRYTTLYKLDWFAELGLVVVSKITPEIIQEAVAALVELNYFEHFIPLANNQRKKGKLKELPQFNVTFPDGFISREKEAELKYEGLVKDVLLEIEDGRAYRLHFEDFFSFTSRFASGARFGEVYFAEPIFVIVPRLLPEVISKAIAWLLEQDYFEGLKG